MADTALPSFSGRGIEDVGQEGEKGKYMDSEGKRTLGRKRQGRGKKGEKNRGFKEVLSKVKEDQVKRAVEDKDPDP